MSDPTPHNITTSAGTTLTLTTRGRVVAALALVLLAVAVGYLTAGLGTLCYQTLIGA